MSHVLPVVSILMMSAVAVGARDIFVSPQGDDGAAGSRQAPFRTIMRAAGKLKPGDVCHVLPGTYEECLHSLPNGLPGAPITIKSEEPQAAVLTGLSKVTTPWTRHRGDVWKTVVPEVLAGRNMVFVDGKPAVRCRWPKRHSVDWLEWDAVDYDPTRSDKEKLVCSKLPERPDGYWKGATLWVMGGHKWTSWSAKVADYDNTAKALRYEAGNNGSKSAAGGAMALNLPQGGCFFLLADEREIAQPNEFYVDEATKTLYLQVPAGSEPQNMDIRLQTRAYVIVGKKASHLRIEGFATLAGSISIADNSSYCTLENLCCSWLGAYDGGDTGYFPNVDIAVMLGGSHNVIRDSEVAYSHAFGVRLHGSDGAIINCHIHDIDFMGSYHSPVQLSGERHLISHCTIHDTGRDCVQPNARASVIQYNNIYNMGRICHDLGATYVCDNDGEGSEYHHNWVHDNKAKGTRMGIYLDNFTCNNLIYKNVVWNVNGCDIRLNRPSRNNFVINNTMLGKCGNWGRWQTDWMYNCGYINNAVCGTIAPHPQVVFLHNTFNIPTEKLNIDNFRQYTDGAGKGFVVPGVTVEHPSIGAYEPGEDWVPGHDFAKKPMPVYRKLETPLFSLVRNGSFTRIWRLPQEPWEYVGQSKVIYGPGGITKCYTERESIIDLAMTLEKDGDGVEQPLSGVKNGQLYEFNGWYKLAKDEKQPATVLFYIKEDGIVSAQVEVKPGQNWLMATLRHTPKAGVREVRVGVSKRGQGVVRVDSFGFVGIVAGMEPKLPGFAPVTPKAPTSAAKLAPRRTEPLRVPTGRAVSDDIKQAPGRRLAPGKPARMTLSQADGVLTVSVDIPLERQPELVAKPHWTADDGTEVCFAFANNNAKQTVFVLHGFVNGMFEASREAGASAEECRQIAAHTVFTAQRRQNGWNAEWKINLREARLPSAIGAVYDFNVGIFRKEAKQWLQWAGTPSQTWLVREAAQIRLE